MIVFGEYALSGYACAQAFNDSYFYTELDYYTQKINKYSDRITIVFGSVTEVNTEHYVSVVVCDKHDINYSHKQSLSKREFNEQRYFKTGKNQAIKISQEIILFTFNDDINDALKLSEFDKVIIVDSKPVNQNLTMKSIDSYVYANTLGNSNVLKTIFINGGNSHIKDENNILAFTHPVANYFVMK